MTITADIHYDIERFYVREAELLDSWRDNEWLGLLSPDFRYRIPIRTMRRRNEGWAGQFRTHRSNSPGDSYHIDENLAAIEMRVKRLDTGIAYAADPPPRYRHFLSNLRVSEGNKPGVFQTKVNVLLIHGEADEINNQALSAERHDTLRRDGDSSWIIEERVVYLDHAVVPVNNLAIFF